MIKKPENIDYELFGEMLQNIAKNDGVQFIPSKILSNIKNSIKDSFVWDRMKTENLYVIYYVTPDLLADPKTMGAICEHEIMVMIKSRSLIHKTKPLEGHLRVNISYNKDKQYFKFILSVRDII